MFWVQYTLELRQRDDDYVRAQLTALGGLIEARDAESYFRPAGVPTPTPLPDVAAAARKAQAELESAASRLRQYAPYAVPVTAIAVVAGLLGLVLTIIGFRLWYVRVQHPQDLLLLKQLESSRNTTA